MPGFDGGVEIVVCLEKCSVFKAESVSGSVFLWADKHRLTNFATLEKVNHINVSHAYAAV